MKDAYTNGRKICKVCNGTGHIIEETKKIKSKER